MSVFEFNPFEVGNPMTLGLAEEEVEDRVEKAVGWLADRFGEFVPFDAFEAAFDKFGIDYDELPEWLKSEFDKFEVEE